MSYITKGGEFPFLNFYKYVGILILFESCMIINSHFLFDSSIVQWSHVY